MMRSIRFLLLAFCCCAVISCEKDDNGYKEDPADVLAGTRWQATLINENPATNPPGNLNNNGNMLYFPWQDCHMDDTFTFKNGKFTVDDNKTVCPDGLKLESQPYTYDAASNKLTIGTGDDRLVAYLYELSETQLKIGAYIPPGNGYEHLVYLFKRK